MCPYTVAQSILLTATNRQIDLLSAWQANPDVPIGQITAIVFALADTGHLSLMPSQPIGQI